jgi:hypothetical protein
MYDLTHFWREVSDERSGMHFSKVQSAAAVESEPVRPSVGRKLSYLGRWLPTFVWQRLVRARPSGKVHIMLAVADHFEPAIVPGEGRARASCDEQHGRIEKWSREYPRLVDRWRDCEGRPFSHTYFYPAEQYDRGLLDRLAAHCREGWGEIEIHLHHGMDAPDTAENTKDQLLEFRDALARNHGALSYLDDSPTPSYAFVHGNFALANSSRGEACGVDSEMQVLSDTGCYADLTLPTGFFHPAQIGKINSLYECTLSLKERAAHRRGRDLAVGKRPSVFPLMVQGPLVFDVRSKGSSRRLDIENGAFTGARPPNIRRLQLWKQAAVRVVGRPDWLFIKLHCHSMDPTQHNAVLGDAMRCFLRELVEGATSRNETLHFVTAREMVNVILAACDGRDGNPGDYRDYRLKMGSATHQKAVERLQQETVRS